MDSAVLWAKELVGFEVEQSFAHVGPLFGVIGCFAIGCLIGVVLVSKIMTLLLKKWRKQTFFTIIGFIGGSVFVLFFNHEIYDYYRVWAGQTIVGIDQLMPMWLEMIVGFLVLTISAFLSYLLVRYQRKKLASEDKEEAAA